MAAAATEGPATDLAAGMRDNPRIRLRVLDLAAVAEIDPRDQGLWVIQPALRAMPIGRHRRQQPRGRRRGRQALTRPRLDAGEVEEGVAAGGAGPGVVGGADPLQADEASDEGALAGRGQEGADLGEVVAIRRGAGRPEVPGEDAVLDGGDLLGWLLPAAAAGVGVGEEGVNGGHGGARQRRERRGGHYWGALAVGKPIAATEDGLTEMPGRCWLNPQEIVIYSYNGKRYLLCISHCEIFNTLSQDLTIRSY